MSVEMSFILSIFVVGIDLQGVALDNRAQQIEAGVLIPPAAFIEVDTREKDDYAQQ